MALKFNRYFFDQSYVNKELIEKIEQRSIKLSTTTGFSKLNKPSCQKR